MARTLLKEKPKTPETRRIRFNAPVIVAERMQALVAAAREHGYDLDLDAALTEAYAAIAKKLERELADAGAHVADPTDDTDDATDADTSATVVDDTANEGRSPQTQPAADGASTTPQQTKPTTETGLGSAA